MSIRISKLAQKNIYPLGFSYVFFLGGGKCMSPVLDSRVINKSRIFFSYTDSCWSGQNHSIGLSQVTSREGERRGLPIIRFLG